MSTLDVLKNSSRRNEASVLPFCWRVQRTQLRRPKCEEVLALVAGVAGGAGTLLLVLIFIIVLLCYRRSKESIQRDLHQQPTAESSYDNPYDECFPESSANTESHITIPTHIRKNGKSNFGNDKLNSNKQINTQKESRTYYNIEPKDPNCNPDVAFDSCVGRNTPLAWEENLLKSPDPRDFDSISKIRQHDYDRIKLQTTKEIPSDPQIQDGHYNVLYSTTDERRDQGHLPNDRSGYELATFSRYDKNIPEQLVSNAGSVKKIKPTVPQKPRKLSERLSNVDTRFANNTVNRKAYQTSVTSFIPKNKSESFSAPQNMETIGIDNRTDTEKQDQNTFQTDAKLHMNGHPACSKKNSSRDKEGHRSYPVPDDMELIENDMYAGFVSKTHSQNIFSNDSMDHKDPPANTTNNSHGNGKHRPYPVPEDMELIENDMYAGFVSQIHSQNTFPKESAGRIDLPAVDVMTSNSKDKKKHTPYPVADDMELVENDMYAGVADVQIPGSPHPELEYVINDIYHSFSSSDSETMI